MALKATRGDVKEHNRRLVLRNIFDGSARNRAALAQITGLTKPTVSDIVSDLIDEGLLEEGGRGESTESGGKRPRLLNFIPSARQIIGVSMNSSHIYGVLANLDGSLVARHHADLNGTVGIDAQQMLYQVINGLVAQLDAPLLCISIGVPGIVLSKEGIVRASPGLHWYMLPLAEQINTIYGFPTYIGNNTELATRAQFAFGTEDHVKKMVTLLVDTTLEIGLAFDGLVYHHSGELGLLRVADGTTIEPSHPLETLLSWSAVKARIGELRQAYPDSMLVTDSADRIRYLHIRRGYHNDDVAAQILVNELADHLAQIFAWITGLIRPDEVVLAGGMADLGPILLELTTERIHQILPPELIDAVTFSLTDDRTLSVTGTITHALQRELGIV